MFRWALPQLSFLQYSLFELARPWPTWLSNSLLLLVGLLVLVLPRALWET